MFLVEVEKSIPDGCSRADVCTRAENDVANEAAGPGPADGSTQPRPFASEPPLASAIARLCSALLFVFQNMSDAMAVLHKLQTGLDVNVKFTGVRVFEYTPECIVFDLLDIPLYHGWLVDPQVRSIRRGLTDPGAMVLAQPPLLPDARHRQGGGQLQLQPAGGEDHFVQAVGQQRAGRGR